MVAGFAAILAIVELLLASCVAIIIGKSDGTGRRRGVFRSARTIAWRMSARLQAVFGLQWSNDNGHCAGRQRQTDRVRFHVIQSVYGWREAKGCAIRISFRPWFRLPSRRSDAIMTCNRAVEVALDQKAEGRPTFVRSAAPTMKIGAFSPRLFSARREFHCRRPAVRGEMADGSEIGRWCSRPNNLL
jgi:hypothetical protein